jgi:hypothetical protein
MRKLAIPFLSFSALGFSALLVVLYFSVPAGSRAQMPEVNAKRTPVLVELFTSEGCSSCPPADLLLQKLLAQQSIAGAQVIALEAHVDYWNRLGWSDPYSSPRWTERQGDYASSFGNDAYTPELVVDGRSNFVGSNAGQAQEEIAQAARQPKADIAITAEKPGGNGSPRFSITVAKLSAANSGDRADVWLAVTEDGLRSSVSRGENAGRTLTHAATLRSLRKIGVAEASAPLSFSGIFPVTLDPHWKAENLRVVVFVQENRSRQILGVAAIPIQA